MNEEQEVVNKGEVETPSTPTVENNEQATNDSEVVENSEADVEKANQQLSNIQKAIEQENEKLRKIREEKKAEIQPVQPEQKEQPQTEVAKEFYDNIRLTKLNNKMLTDPSFKERAELVKQEMETTGKDIEDADNAVLARALRASQEVAQPSNNQQQQITPSAEQAPINSEQKSIKGDNAFSAVTESKSAEAQEYQRIMKEVGMPGL